MSDEFITIETDAKPTRPSAAELAIIAGDLETFDGGQLSPDTLANLRALGYVGGDPLAVTVAGKSLIETYRLKRAGITK